MDSRLGNQERMNLYSEALLKFSEAKQLPELFRGIFKSAFLPYRSPEVLGLFLKEIDYFDYSHSEELGNAYEYLLSIMGSQGDAGQFRTPRHIIDFIVAAVNPTKDDKVLDPACGTAGFLVSAYKHILEQHDGKNQDGSKNEEKALTPDQRRALMNNFEGYDVDPGMVRISQVNMYLHHFSNPKIYNYNTLSQDERWADKFDVLLANPPFMSPKGGVSTHNKFSVPSSRSEVLFVDYIMNHLRPKGRAGIIVPEGIIFQSGTAHKLLRKNLVEDGLYAVVSLPSGVFQPYSGVKTSILLFDYELAKKTDEILFIKVKTDGTDLGAKKRATEANDLPVANTLINQFRDGKFTNSKIAHKVSKQLIIDSGDYNLSGDRYKIVAEVESKFDLVDLGKLIFEQSERANSKNGLEVWSVSNKDGFVLSSEYFEKQVPSDDTSNYKVIKPICFAYNPSRINVGSLAFNNSNKTGIVSPMYVVFSIKENSGLSPNYLFRLLKSDKLNEFILQLAQGAVRQQLRFKDLQLIRIPLPPLEIQEKIVAELDGYQNITTGARQVVENWKPKIDIDSEWEKGKLGEVVDIFNGSTPKRTDASYWENGTIPWFTIEDIRTQGRFITGTGQKITEKGYKESSVKLLPKDTVLLCCTASIGEYAYAEIELTTNQQFNGLIVKDSCRKKLNSKYLFWYSSRLKDELERMSGKATFGFVSVGTLKGFEISLPPLETQKQIVEKIEAERALVESAKKLIEIYEQKTKDVLSGLWKE